MKNCCWMLVAGLEIKRSPYYSLYQFQILSNLMFFVATKITGAWLAIGGLVGALSIAVIPTL